MLNSKTITLTQHFIRNSITTNLYYQIVLLLLLLSNCFVIAAMKEYSKDSFNIFHDYIVHLDSVILLNSKFPQILETICKSYRQKLWKNTMKVIINICAQNDHLFQKIFLCTIYPLARAATLQRYINKIWKAVSGSCFTGFWTRFAYSYII